MAIQVVKSFVTCNQHIFQGYRVFLTPPVTHTNTKKNHLWIEPARPLALTEPMAFDEMTLDRRDTRN